MWGVYSRLWAPVCMCVCIYIFIIIIIICIYIYKCLQDVKLWIKQYLLIEYKWNYKEQIWNKMYLSS